jgi:antirestriction protein ArdC
MGSAFLCAALGIVPTVRHADYLASWLAVLREDNRAVFRAASQASKAADWLLSRYRETLGGAYDASPGADAARAVAVGADAASAGAASAAA